MEKIQWPGDRKYGTVEEQERAWGEFMETVRQWEGQILKVHPNVMQRPDLTGQIIVEIRKVLTRTFHGDEMAWGIQLGSTCGSLPVKPVDIALRQFLTLLPDHPSQDAPIQVPWWAKKD